MVRPCRKTLQSFSLRPGTHGNVLDVGTDHLSFNVLLVLAPPNDHRNALQASLVTHDHISDLVIQIHNMRPHGTHTMSGNVNEPQNDSKS